MSGSSSMRNSCLEPDPLSQLHRIESKIDDIANRMSANFALIDYTLKEMQGRLKEFEQKIMKPYHTMTGSGTQVEEENSSPKNSHS
jgi:hypothetical protein